MIARRPAHHCASPQLAWILDVAGDIALGALLAMVLMGPLKPAMPADQQPTRVAMSGPPTFTDAGATGEALS
jgi:hypothetical protein